jgi:hypothetical protein
VTLEALRRILLNLKKKLVDLRVDCQPPLLHGGELTD